MLNHKLRGLLAICLFALSASGAFASETGNLKVLVVDGDGLALPGATITVKSPALMGARNLTSGNGPTLMPNLPPGVYEVGATLTGFGTATQTNVRISLQTTNTITLKLTPSMKTEITVSADTPIIDTSSAAVASHIQLETVESLPVARDYVSYMQLVAGVNMVPNAQGVDTPQEPAGRGGLNYSDRGSQTNAGGKSGSRDNIYYLDGVNITGLVSQSGLLQFNNEVIQEQELISSGVPAEFAGGKGIVANIVTRSGGNDFSGTANLYGQTNDMVQDYSDGTDARLLAPIDDKYDTAFTLGGPVISDRAWFFGSGQLVNSSNDVVTSPTASPSSEVLPFEVDRKNLFGKVSLSPTDNDQIVVEGFWADGDTTGTRDINTVPDRRTVDGTTYKFATVYYQRLIGGALTWDARYGRYQRDNNNDPIAPDAGPFNDVLFFDPEPPAYLREFGGARDTFTGINKRDQVATGLEWFGGAHTVRGGFTYTREQDSDEIARNQGQSLISIDPSRSGITIGEVIDGGLFAASEVTTQLFRRINEAPGSSAFNAADTNGDGTVSIDELRAMPLSASNQHGLNFVRNVNPIVGPSNVKATRWSFYAQDDFQITDQLALNAGLRVAKNTYFKANDDEILSIDPVFLPRVGLSMDLTGDGTSKLSAFYGHYVDDIPFAMVHFGGNNEGTTTDEQFWVNDSEWFTYRTRGPNDAIWAPDTKDGLSKELALTFQQDFGGGLTLGTQAYWRKDDNIIEDYDFSLYAILDNGDFPGFEQLKITPEEFGFTAEEAANANFGLGNLVGGEREYRGFDVDVRKRFSNGSLIAGQYAYKWAEGNSTSDGNADFQGDLHTLDPRLPWMNGPLPGTIPHSLKLFGTYKTSFGLDIGSVLYMTKGWTYTESEIFRFSGGEIYVNKNLNGNNIFDATEFVQLGQEQNPSYYQMDLKLAYKLPLGNTEMQFFLDIYNLTNNQSAVEEFLAHNGLEFDYQEETRLLLPRRLYMGARFSF